MTTRLRRRHILLTTGLAMLLGACSGASTPAAIEAPSGAAAASQQAATASSLPSAADSSAPATAAPDPCSLLTDAEAGTLLGGPATHKTGGSKDASNGSGVVVTQNRCEWDRVKSSGLGYDLWITVYSGADRAYFDDLVTHETPIPGLGEAAAGYPFSDGGGGFSEVEVISKGTVIGIYGSLPARDGIQQAAGIASAKL
jgi:hypothetical protein